MQTNGLSHIPLLVSFIQQKDKRCYNVVHMYAQYRCRIIGEPPHRFISVIYSDIADFMAHIIFIYGCNMMAF